MPTTVRPVLSNKCLSLNNDQPICKHLVSALQTLVMLATHFRQEKGDDSNLLRERIRDRATTLLDKRIGSERILNGVCSEALFNLATALRATPFYVRLNFNCNDYQSATENMEIAAYKIQEILDGEMDKDIFELVRELGVNDEVALRRTYPPQPKEKMVMVHLPH